MFPEVVDDVRTGLRDRFRERRASRRFRRRVDGLSAETTDDAPRHVICVVVDALRADAVTAEGAPFVAGLAGGDAVSPSTWTFPAVTSLLTGRYPHGHGAMRESDADDVSVVDITGLPEPADAPGLSERLGAAGYDTYGAFGFVVPFLALGGRFGEPRLYDDAAAERVLDDHRSWLADRRGERTFSYLHLADLHEPVDPPRDYWRAHDVADLADVRRWRYEDIVETSPTVDRYRRHRQRLYRAAVEYVDNRLGAYHRRVTDLLDDVAFVVVGDHGEGFWERAAFHAEHFVDPRPAYCVGHGGAPYEAVTRVPLRTDGLDLDQETSRRAAGDGPSSSLVDVAPTLARATGVDLGPVDGVPLDRRPDDRLLLTEGTRYGYEKKAVYGDAAGEPVKFLVSQGDDVAVGLSLPDEERRDLPPDVEERFRAALPTWPDGSSAERETSRSVERQLEHLGYQ